MKVARIELLNAPIFHERAISGVGRELRFIDWNLISFRTSEGPLAPPLCPRRMFLASPQTSSKILVIRIKHRQIVWPRSFLPAMVAPEQLFLRYWTLVAAGVRAGWYHPVVFNRHLRLVPSSPTVLLALNVISGYQRVLAWSTASLVHVWLCI